MQIEKKVQSSFSLNNIQRIKTQSLIFSFEVIDHTLYYLSNNKLVIYDLENNKTLQEIQFYSYLSALAIQGNNIYVAQGDQQIIKFNILNQKKNKFAQYKDCSVKKIVVVNNLLIYLKYDQAQLFITDLKLNKTITKIQCFEDHGWDLKTSFKQNNLIAVTYADWVYQGIKIYDLNSLTLFSNFRSDYYYSLVEFSEDQEFIFIIDIFRVRQFNIRTKELIQQINNKRQIFGISIYEQQFFILQGNQIQLVNYQNKGDMQQLLLPKDFIFEDLASSSNEFKNALRVNQQYIVWIINKNGKGIYIQRKY
ncbi:hypothetical protein pb186bvf_006082 [Paramecium bursaria]